MLKELDLSELPTKGDLRALKVSLIQWMVGIQIGYGALIIAAVTLF